MLRTALVLTALIVFLPWAARASDPPHWAGSPEGDAFDCTSNCHVPHVDQGGNLTQAAGNVNLCLSCHSTATVDPVLRLSAVDRGVPGRDGTSHGFDVPVVNATWSTQTPNDSRTPTRRIRCFLARGEKGMNCRLDQRTEGVGDSAS